MCYEGGEYITWMWWPQWWMTRGWQFFLNCLTLMMKALPFFETVGTTRPSTHCHMTQDLNRQQCRCDIRKSLVRYLRALRFFIAVGLEVICGWVCGMSVSVILRVSMEYLVTAYLWQCWIIQNDVRALISNAERKDTCPPSTLHHSAEQGYVCSDVSGTNVSEVNRIASSMVTAGSGKVFWNVARVGFARRSFVSDEIWVEKVIEEHDA
jgi:hypothetical protein